MRIVCQGNLISNSSDRIKDNKGNKVCISVKNDNRIVLFNDSDNNSLEIEQNLTINNINFYNILTFLTSLDLNFSVYQINEYTTLQYENLTIDIREFKKHNNIIIYTIGVTEDVKV